MTARAPLSSFLTETTSDERSDRALRPEDFPALWARFEGFARTLIVARLSRHSLRKAHAYAGAGEAFEGLLASPSVVRGDLLKDDDHLKDLLQDVAIALCRTLRAGKLAAAAPAVKEWFRTTVRRIVPRASRAAAVHYFSRGTPPCGKEEKEVDEAATEPPARGLDLAVLAETNETLARVQSHAEQLPPRERVAFERWVTEVPYADVAAELGVTEVNARVLLSRALGRLREAMPDQVPPSARRFASSRAA